MAQAAALLWLALALPVPAMAAAPLAQGWFTAASAGPPACEGAGRRVHAGFERAAMAACRIDGDGHVHVTIRPENQPINPSPWYGLVLTNAGNSETLVTLHYDGGRHRYAPWLGQPGQKLVRLDMQRLALAEEGRSAQLRLPAAAVQLLIAQPPETVDSVLADFEARVRAGRLQRVDVGHSVARRPIATYWHRPPQARATIVLITRQHPPETTGPQAFARFTDVLLGDSPAAQAFRGRHALMIVPLANPDGFVLGHWRHNLGGVDLNRDWGPFTQPETRALSQAIESQAQITPIMAVIDFHSTQRDVIYAPPKPAGPDLGEAMLTAIAADLDGASIRIDRAHNPGNGVLKSWARDRFGVGALTWEVGDDSPEDRTRRLAEAAAHALMASANARGE